MPDLDIDLDSGAKLHVTMCPFIDCKALTDALLKSLKGTPISTDDIFGKDIGVLKDLIIEALTSQEVDRALWKCMARSTYKLQRITPDLFDDLKNGETAREDFYRVCLEVIQVNCKPFFVKTFSWLKAHLQKNTNTPELKSEQTVVQ